jgi:hypothetical protein
MALRPRKHQLYVTNSFAIAVVTGVLAGATLALAVGVATGAPLGVDVAAGAVAAAIVIVALARFMGRSYGTAPMLDEAMFPSQQNR